MSNEELDEDCDYTPDLYTLIDEEGLEQTFELLDIMDVDDERYFALLPFFEDADAAINSDADLIVLKAEMIDGEELMASIDDDEEYEKIGNLFLEKLANMYEDELAGAQDNL